MTTPTDLINSMIKGLVISTAVIMTARYFGYRVRGGPVEVFHAPHPSGRGLRVPAFLPWKTRRL